MPIKTMKIHNQAVAGFFVLLLVMTPTLVKAETDLGTFCWRIDQDSQVTGDVVCLDVEENDISFGLTGIVTSEDLEISLPVFGAAGFDEFNPGIILASLDFIGIAFFAVIDESTLSGVWMDEADNSGNFVFLGPVVSMAEAKTLVQAPVTDGTSYLETLDQPNILQQLMESQGK